MEEKMESLNPKPILGLGCRGFKPSEEGLGGFRV